MAQSNIIKAGPTPDQRGAALTAVAAYAVREVMEEGGGRMTRKAALAAGDRVGGEVLACLCAALTTGSSRKLAAIERKCLRRAKRKPGSAS